MAGWLDLFERMLTGRDHLMGEFTAADCAAFPFLKYARSRAAADHELFHVVLERHQRLGDGHRRLAAWIDRVDARPRVLRSRAIGYNAGSGREVEMKEYWPAPKTGADTIREHGDGLLPEGEDADSVAKAWSDAGFDDEMTTRWLKARCFDPEMARALTDMGVIPEQAGKRTRDGGGYVDTIAYKVANGDLSPRQGAARCLSSR